MPIGWGWGLRMSSPRRVLAAIDAANRAGVPAVLTVHPWEIDPDPPRVRLPARLHFAHYFRLSGFRTRLREVLRGSARSAASATGAASARVVTVSAVARHVDAWRSVPGSAGVRASAAAAQRRPAADRASTTAPRIASRDGCSTTARASPFPVAVASFAIVCRADRRRSALARDSPPRQRADVADVACRLPRRATRDDVDALASCAPRPVRRARRGARRSSRSTVDRQPARARALRRPGRGDRSRAPAATRSASRSAAGADAIARRGDDLYARACAVRRSAGGAGAIARRRSTRCCSGVDSSAAARVPSRAGPPQPDAGHRRVVDGIVCGLGTDVAIMRGRVGRRRACAARAGAARGDLLTHDVDVSIDDGRRALTLTRRRQDVTRTVPPSPAVRHRHVLDVSRRTGASRAGRPLTIVAARSGRRAPPACHRPR